MKSTFQRLAFKSRDLRENVKNEGMSHKARMIGFAALAASVSVTYLQFFSNLLFRSGQFQARALAGLEQFNDARDKYDSTQFAMKHYYDVLNSKSFKELKYIQEGWKDRSWTPTGFTGSVAAGPQDADYTGYHTQTENWLTGGYQNKAESETVTETRTPLEVDEKKWQDWFTMHDDVVWFDTAACFSTSGQIDFIGKVNAVNWNPSRWSGSWFRGTTEYPNPINNDGAVDWSSDIVPAGPSDSMNWTDEDLYRDVLKLTIDIVDDCDIDCQARGSQLTLVAILNTAALAFVFVNNGICLALGACFATSRMIATYCNFFGCMFHMVILIVSGTFLFTPYAQMCGNSMVKTAGKDLMWTMSDDYSTVVFLWATSFPLLFIFFCIGLCGAYKAQGGGN